MRVFRFIVLLGLVSASTAQQPPPPEDAATTEAARVLKKHCARCHATDAVLRTKAPKRPKGGFEFEIDLERLARDTDYVNPGKPESSYVYEVIADGTMPEDDPDALDDGDRRAIFDWIKSLSRRQPATTLFTEEAIVAAILEDQRSHRRRANRFRYLTLTHFHNLGEDADTLRFLRDATTKTVFSLSWKPELEELVAVGPEGTVLRVDLDAIGWSREKWELLVVRYPYGVLLQTRAEREMQALAETKMPYLRADWFAFQATRPPLYERLLAPDDAPRILDSDAALERYLRIDVAKNVYEGRAVRYGIPHRKSGVSFNNRMIERHPIEVYDGAYWKSYDFKSSSGRRNLLSHPLGPQSLNAWITDHERAVTFRHDGGEIIWNLPNGLQAYLLVDANGSRIDEGPLEIVYDANETTRKRGVIVNGISCMACHDQGMKRPLAPEAVGPAAEKFHRPRVRETVETLYATDAAFAQLLEQDTARFLRGLRKAGVLQATLVSSQEPVLELVQRFEQRLSLEIAAAELGLSASELLDRLGGKLYQLKKILEDDLLDRDEWVLRFGEVVEATNKGAILHGTERVVGTLGGPSRASAASDLAWAVSERVDPDPAIVDLDTIRRLKSTGLPWRVRDNVTGIEMVLIPPGRYRRGASPGDDDAYGDEQPAHEVVIDEPFYLSVHEVTNAQYRKHAPSHDIGSYQSRSLNADDQPVANVSWDDASAFCKTFGFRLPSEAEWEYAARAGTTTRYPWGDDPTGGRGHANVADSTSKSEFDWSWDAFPFDDRHRVAAPVGTFRANGLGLHDMIGNVWEWCADPYHSDSYQKYSNGAAAQSAETAVSSSRALRGGSWVSNPRDARVSRRYGGAPSVRNGGNGFRVARAPR